MRMTHTLARHRTFTTNIASKSHKARIVPDSPSQSKKVSETLQYLKGVGPARAKILSDMGLYSPRDLLGYYPRDWEDRRMRHAIREAPIGEKTTLRGTIRSIEFSMTRSRLGFATARISDSSGEIQAIWFKKTTPRYDVFSSLRNQLQPGKSLMVFGVLEWGPEGRQIRAEDFAVLPDESSTLSGNDQFHFERIVPLYTVPEGLQERLLRSLIGRLLMNEPFHMTDLIPETIRRDKQLRNRTWAISNIHFPQTLIEKEEARRLLASEEFLILETALSQRRLQMKKQLKPHRYTLRRHLLTPFREHLKFEFTAAQKKVIREIFDDLSKPEPMHRLLQGDVGSGKTLVALSAMLLAVENGGQAALMAPTEILAEQHALTFARFLDGLPVRVGILSSRTPVRERKRLLEDILKGEILIVIGTHALIQKHVRFRRLLLAVVDEQHRFGVEHRNLLREKGGTPDILVMTATPIPRTLAMTVYGDLDVSILDALPPGRSPITTAHVSEESAYALVRNAVQQGRQAYVVFPLVSESGKVELKAVTQEAERFRETSFRGWHVGLLHGQLTSREKENVMRQFRDGAIQILLATSIIEVGIDVPNASLMVIQHAERFGLSTLHQLRGRVGRGPFASQCLLVADVRSEEARKRIQVMTHTTDGFLLSEEDLLMRGPGEILGDLQHGMPFFKLGHLIHDARIIQDMRVAAETIVRNDPTLSAPDLAPLKAAIRDHYGAEWSLRL
jgi:ATP-dependent DNA helicase RecG